MTKLGQTYLVKFKVKEYGPNSSDISKLGNVHLLAFCDEAWKMSSTHAITANPDIRYALVKSKARE